MENVFGTLAVVSNSLLAELLDKAEIVVSDEVSASSFNSILDGFYKNGRFIYDDSVLIAINLQDGILRKVESGVAGKNIVDGITGNYIVDDEPIGGVFTLDGDANLLVATKKFVDDALRAQENMRYLADCFKGDYSGAEFADKQAVDKEAIIQEYLETHKKTYPHLQKANQERSEECSYRTALYLAEFCGGSSKKEIAQKHGIAYSTVHRLLILNDKKDMDRLMQIYSLHRELFTGFTEKDVEDCLRGRLNKKAESLEKRLTAAREFIAKNTPSEDDTPSDDDWSE